MTAPSREAIARAGRIFAEALARRDAMTPREAAEAAYRPGGPSVDELEARIRAARGLAAGAAWTAAKTSHKTAASG